MRLLWSLTIILISASAFADTIKCESIFDTQEVVGVSHRFTEAFREVDANRAVIADSPIVFEKREIDSIAATLAGLNERNDAMVVRIKNGKIQTQSAFRLFTETVRTKIEAFTADFINQFELQRGMAISRGTIILRVTADGAATKIEGFHNHFGPSRTNAVDFVWTLEGAGTVLKINDSTIAAPTGKIVLFGMNVMHGSPDSTSRRVLILGDFDP